MELEEATMLERMASWSFSKFKKVCSSTGEKMPKPPSELPKKTACLFCFCSPTPI